MGFRFAMKRRAFALIVFLVCMRPLHAEAQLSIGSACSTVGWTTLQPNQIVYCNSSRVLAAGEEITNTGLVGIANTNPGVLLDIGTAGSTLGAMRLEGSTSGYVGVQASAAAGSWTMTLPTSGGTSGYCLQTDGVGNTSWGSCTGGGMTTIDLGTSASVTNPQRSGEAGTGLFSAVSGTTSIASTGTDVMDVSCPFGKGA